MSDDPADSVSEAAEQRTRDGLIAALLAYLLWGIFPIYFKILKDVPATEVLAQRIVWSVPFGALIIAFRSQWPEVRAILVSPRTLGMLALSSAIIAVNWLIYIVAVQGEQVFQASLGYYINPLTNVLAGVLLFGERLTRLQIAAVGLAGLGVAVLAAGGGSVPWISLALAVSFTGYAVIRKQVAVGGMPGLFAETLFLMPFGMAYLAWLVASGAAVFLSESLAMDGLLMLAGPFTVVPLLLFALGARRLDLTTIGMLQFIAPTLQFGVAVAYGETLTAAHVFCFVCIWLAISLFVLDAWQKRRRHGLPAAGRAA